MGYPVYQAGGAVLFWIALATPSARHLLESTMTLHMLVQIPLLVCAGWLMIRAIPKRLDAAIAKWNYNGVSGLLLASLASMVWMLPRELDGAIDYSVIELAKFLSVPLLIGGALALSWRRMSFVVRGVFMVELIATTFRLGWLYLVSPVRLCSNYPLNQQEQLGQGLLVIGCVISLLLAWQLLCGRIKVERSDQ